jgi:hypothetical protein
MTAKRRWACIGLALALMAAGLCIAASFLVRGPDRMPFAEYRAIRSGMSRIEVRRLMRDAGIVMYTGVSNSEIMHIDGRFMIAVVYEPTSTLAAAGTSPTGPPQDDWVVKEKVFLELGRGGRVDDLLVGLRMKPQRVVERDRMPR